MQGYTLKNFVFWVEYTYFARSFCIKTKKITIFIVLKIFKIFNNLKISY